jgi:uncharacterized protein YjiS (DUF1127 family)
MSGRVDRGAGLALFAAGLAGVFAPLAPGPAARRRKAELTALMELDDHLLADIGLDRDAIARARWSGGPLARMGWHG